MYDAADTARFPAASIAFTYSVCVPQVGVNVTPASPLLSTGTCGDPIPSGVSSEYSYATRPLTEQSGVLATVQPLGRLSCPPLRTKVVGCPELLVGVPGPPAGGKSGSVMLGTVGRLASTLK